MKLNEIDFDKMSDKELVILSLKYKLIEQKEIPSMTRKKLLELIKQFIQKKLTVYGTKKQTDIKTCQIQRRMSTSGKPQKNMIHNNSQGPPRAIRERRMSQPITKVEKVQTSHDHNVQETKQQSHQVVKQQLQTQNPKYDIIGMYPPVKRLVAVGDLHGDFRVTIQALQLAEVIPQTADIQNIDTIHWSGGSTWVIQLGDQIDRCRPDDWKQNCIKDLSDVVDDEGNNMKIIKLLLRLDEEAKKVGGRVLGLLGNHELMNVDKDFRYVSPREFLEFVPESERNTTYTDDGYPLGYYHRKKAFERGGNISNMYAMKKKSIMTIGSFLFVHGGISNDLASKYSLAEINTVVSKWLLKKETTTEETVFDEIFRDDDDMSPFWCRIFGEDEGENTEASFNELVRTLNQKNKLLMPIQGMVIAHTPQFMDNKYLNSMYNNRLWRIDVGMSRAFGNHCASDKYRQIQILIIHDNSKFEVRKKPFGSGRHPSSNMGSSVNLQNQSMPF
jgi:hypothetical protein